jgi:hypothetical protein
MNCNLNPNTKLEQKDVEELAKFSVFLNLMEQIRKSDLSEERKKRRAKALHRLIYGRTNRPA